MKDEGVVNVEYRTRNVESLGDKFRMAKLKIVIRGSSLVVREW